MTLAWPNWDSAYATYRVMTETPLLPPAHYWKLWWQNSLLSAMFTFDNLRPQLCVHDTSEQWPSPMCWMKHESPSTLLSCYWNIPTIAWDGPWLVSSYYGVMCCEIVLLECPAAEILLTQQNYDLPPRISMLWCVTTTTSLYNSL